jgi:hypothetical protein
MQVERTATILIVPLLVGLAACPGRDVEPDPDDAGSDPTDAGPEPDPSPLVIHFEHLVNGEPVALSPSGTNYTNAAGNAFGVARLQYFVTDVTVTFTDDREVTASGPHYVDLEIDVGRDLEVASSVEPGELRSISFVMGIPAEQNVTGSMLNPPESLMFWPDSMGGGYHYMKLEGRFLNSAGDPANFRAHTGPTDGSDYSIAVTLDATGKNVPEGGATFDVEMNIDQWFTDPNTWDFDDYFVTPGIMEDPVKQAELQENGATVFTLGE